MTIPITEPLFSEACERNKAPILSVLERFFTKEMSVLEVGSGTGQHAQYFAERLPHVTWQTADHNTYYGDLAERVMEADLENLLAPFRLDVNDRAWLAEGAKVVMYDAVFTANTLHIMDVDTVENFFKGLPSNTRERALLVVYGPFSYAGEFTSESNAEFDRALRSRGVGSAIRDAHWIHELAELVGFVLLEDITMPANNQCLVYQRNY